MRWPLTFGPWRRRPVNGGKRTPRRAKPRGGRRERLASSRVPAAAALALVVVAHVLFFPVTRSLESDFPDVGAIAEAEIRAPFDFEAPLPEQDIEMRQLQRVLVEPPVLQRLGEPEAFLRERLATLGRIQADLAGLAALLPTDRREILALRYPQLAPGDLATLSTLKEPGRLLAGADVALTTLYAHGVVDDLPPGNYRKVSLLADGGESDIDTELLIRQDELGERLHDELAAVGLPPERLDLAERLLRPLLVPNLTYDTEMTRARRLAARQSVPSVKEYLRGERLVDRGERVTEEDALALRTLEGLMSARAQGEASEELLGRSAARLVLVTAMVLLCGLVLGIHVPTALSDPRKLACLTLSLVLFQAGAAAALNEPSLGVFAVPVIWLAVFTTTMFRDRVGYPVVILAAALAAFSSEMDALSLLALLILGPAAVTLVRRIRQRDQFYQAIAVLAGLGLLLVALLELASGRLDTRIWNGMLVALLSPMASVALALFLLPLIEPLVGVSSDLTLLELSDLNHPLLKRMALECQGTFHHSQVVGQLAEHAARAIGANSLLTRVGALFHDIGKMTKPEYFVENQGGGRNRHDELSPSMSALVVGAHVKEGIELGRKWRLPQAVIDFIPEHHGTNVMKYFYHKALEDPANETVKVDDFRYPGPRPRSRETAILMLADAVEAATRSLAKPTPGRIREMVKQIADDRMLSGELDECGLTLRDLATIREAFIPLLTSIHHARIAYPGQRERGADAEERS